MSTRIVPVAFAVAGVLSAAIAAGIFDRFAPDSAVDARLRPTR